MVNERAFWRFVRRFSWFLPAIFGLFSFLLIIFPTHAQTSASAFLSQPDTKKFPQITTYLHVQDSQGFVGSLRASVVNILEDDQQIPVRELTEIQPGVQLIVVVSPGPSFAIRDSLGKSRYTYIVEALRIWSGIPSQSPPDDLSLIAAGYPEALHLSIPRSWFDSFDSYQPDARNAVPSLDMLTRSLEVAGGESPRAGMGRAILFITAPQDAEAMKNLQELATRAKQEDIQVFVWLLSAPEMFTSQGSLQLQNLANQTGGQFFTFSGGETIPDLGNLLEPLRHAYALSYDSKIAASGTHQVAAEINTADLEIKTLPRSFELKVLPPNPIFVSLPASITRAKPEGEAVKNLVSAAAHSPNLVPVEQSLEVLIEFPDGYPRSLTRTALYVDGALIMENTTPPFDKFTWDLRSYVTSGKHLLRVEVVDSLGLTGKSIDTGVHITILQPPRSFWSLLFTWQNASLAGLVGLAAVLLVVLLLVLGGRLRPRGIDQVTRPVSRRLPARQRSSTRLAAEQRQPEEGTSAQHIPNWLNRLQLHQHRPTSKAPAYLVPLSEAEDAPTVAPIPVTANVVIFGRDSLQATLVLDDASVDALHARLKRENNLFRLVDAGSTAGTWVNYTPVSQEGIILENGDFIHIGRIGFRFVQRESGVARKLVVYPISAEQEKLT